jgi:transcriptional antiterminator NusG
MKRKLLSALILFYSLTLFAQDKKKIKVIVKIFGRGTEVELNFMQVEKTS